MHDEAGPRRPVDYSVARRLAGGVVELAHSPASVDKAAAAPDRTRGQVEHHWSHDVERWRRPGRNSLEEIGWDDGVIVEYHERGNVGVPGEVVEAKVPPARTTEVASRVQDDRWKVGDVRGARGIEGLLPVLDEDDDIRMLISDSERSKAAGGEGVLVEIHDNHAHAGRHGEQAAPALSAVPGEVSGTPVSQSGKCARPCF